MYVSYVSTLVAMASLTLVLPGGSPLTVDLPLGDQLIDDPDVVLLNLLLLLF